MAKTNRSNPITTNPVDRRDGSHKGTGKGGPPPAQHSARTNPSAAVGDSIDPRLLKPPPESIPPATGDPDMPSLVARAKALPYPLRNNRTPAPNSPAVIYGKKCAPGDVSLLNECAPGDVSLLNFRLPSLPPITHGIPDAIVKRRELDRQELDFGHNASAGGG